MKKAQNLQDVALITVSAFLFLYLAFIGFEYMSSMLQKMIDGIPVFSKY